MVSSHHQCLMMKSSKNSEQDFGSISIVAKHGHYAWTMIYLKNDETERQRDMVDMLLCMAARALLTVEEGAWSNAPSAGIHSCFEPSQAKERVGVMWKEGKRRKEVCVRMR